LGDTRHVEGHYLDLVYLTGLLGMEKMLTLVQPSQRIFLADEEREGEFVEEWHTSAISFGMCIGEL
jgi:hypothetical protein